MIRIIITVFLTMNAFMFQNIDAQVFPWLNGSSSSRSSVKKITRPPLNPSKPWTNPSAYRPAARVAVTPSQQNLPWKYGQATTSTRRSGQINSPTIQRSRSSIQRSRPAQTVVSSDNLKAYPWNPHLLPPKREQATQASTAVYRQPAIDNYPKKITPKTTNNSSYQRTYPSKATYNRTPSPIATQSKPVVRQNYVERNQPQQPVYQTPTYNRNQPSVANRNVKKAQPSPWLADNKQPKRVVTKAPDTQIIVTPPAPVVQPRQQQPTATSNFPKAKKVAKAPWLSGKNKRNRKKNKAAPVYTEPNSPTIVVETQRPKKSNRKDAFAPTPVRTVPLDTYPIQQESTAKTRVIRPKNRQQQATPKYQAPEPAIVINTPQKSTPTRARSTADDDIFAAPPPASKQNSPQDQPSIGRNSNDPLASPDNFLEGETETAEESGFIDVENIRGTVYLEKAVLKERLNYFHDGNWQSLLKRAKKEKRYFFVDFMTDWCRVCKEMEHATFADFDVRNAVEKRFIAYQLNGEKRADLAKKYGVSKYPTLLFFDKNGQEIGRKEGFLSKSTFMNALAEFKAQVPHTQYTEFR